MCHVDCDGFVQCGGAREVLRFSSFVFFSLSSFSCRAERGGFCGMRKGRRGFWENFPSDVGDVGCWIAGSVMRWLDYY